MLSHEKNAGDCGAKNSGYTYSVVAKGPRFPGGVGVVFLIAGEDRIFTETALIWRFLIKKRLIFTCLKLFAATSITRLKRKSIALI